MSALASHIVVTSLLVLLHSASAQMECYQCDSYTTAECGKHFDSTHIGTSDNCTSCVAMAADTVFGLRVYFRDCSSVLFQLDRHANLLHIVDTITVKQCHEDLCNVMDPGPVIESEDTTSPAPVDCVNAGDSGAVSFRLVACWTGIVLLLTLI